MYPIATYNIRHSSKSQEILQKLKTDYKDAIICVQESTHCPIDGYNIEKSDGPYPYRLSTYIPENIKYVRYENKFDGMVLHIRIIYDEEPIDIFNVHIKNGNPQSGNEEARRIFDEEFHNMIEQWPNNRIIIAGDFNCCIYNGDMWKHPVSGRDPKKIDEQRAAITAVIKKVGLHTMGRYCNPQKPIHEIRTFISSRCKKRDFSKKGWLLDHIFCTTILKDKHKFCTSLQDITFSDHVPVVWYS